MFQNLQLPLEEVQLGFKDEVLSQAQTNHSYHIICSFNTLKDSEKCYLTECFENVKNQIGFCGIWCGSCFGGNGAVLELTRKYEQIIKRSQSALEKWAPKEFDFNEFMKGLACVQAMPLSPGCKEGGGNSTCEIRNCASKKNIANCSLCDGLTECKNFESLEQDYPKIKAELKKIKNVDQKEVIENWMSELRTKWPHCTLLCESPRKSALQVCRQLNTHETIPVYRDDR
jgi:hypothetical protein